MSNSSSNSTNRTTLTPHDSLLANLTTSSQVFIYFCISSHLIFIIFVGFFSELRTRHLVFINHAVLANLLYPIGTFVFQYVDPNTMTNQQQTVVRLCSFFEIYWPFSIYLRMYSIVLIAVHRYLAVFWPDYFRKLNDSVLYLSVPIGFIWSISLAFTLVIKYAFRTTYSLTSCLSGFSTVFIDSLVSTLLYVSLSLIIPAIAIVTLYVIIWRRLNQLGGQLGKSKIKIVLTTETNYSNENNVGLNRTISIVSVRINKRKEMKFANQFILLCSVVVLTIMGIAVFSFRTIIPNYFNVMYYWRPVIRCWIMFFSALVPIFSFYFNPSRHKIYNLIFCNKTIQNSSNNSLENSNQNK